MDLATAPSYLLRELHLQASRIAPAMIVDTSLASRLARLSVELPWFWQPWLDALQRALCPIPVITLRYNHDHMVLTFERDDRGEHSRLTVDFTLPVAKNRPYVENRAVEELLPELAKISPSRLTALTVRPSRRFTVDAMRDRLRKGLEPFASVPERVFP